MHVSPHPALRRDGTELYYDASVSIAQAALGTSLVVPTVEGDEEVEVKPGTQPGTEIRLRGRGVPHLRRSGVRGDLHVLVDVEVPTRLSHKQRELLEAYAEESGETVGGGGGLIDKVLGKKRKAGRSTESRGSQDRRDAPSSHRSGDSKKAR